MEDAALLDIVTGLGGGAAVTVIAWTLLYFIWKRYELSNGLRIDEIIKRADICEADRELLRSEVRAIGEKLYKFESEYTKRITIAMEKNNIALTDLTAAIRDSLH